MSSDEFDVDRSGLSACLTTRRAFQACRAGACCSAFPSIVDSSRLLRTNNNNTLASNLLHPLLPVFHLLRPPHLFSSLSSLPSPTLVYTSHSFDTMKFLSAIIAAVALATYASAQQETVQVERTIPPGESRHSSRASRS